MYTGNNPASKLEMGEKSDTVKARGNDVGED